MSLRCLIVLVCASVALRSAEAPGQLRVIDGLTLVLEQGAPAELAAQEVRLLGPRAVAMLAVSSLDPSVAAMRKPAALAAVRRTLRPTWLSEATALAAGLKVDADLLLAANSASEVQCTALAHRPPGGPAAGPLAVARNMDFAPADLLGPQTVVKIIRPKDKHAFVSVGWPGMIAVVSGMNDAGVVACCLLRFNSHGVAGGMPLFFALRAILEDATDVEQAVAIYRANPTSAGHYIFLADAKGAAVVWRAGATVHRSDLKDRWLACTNGPLRDASTWPEDQRGRFLHNLATGSNAPATPDLAWLRQATAATYLPRLNAQAMVFIPAERRLHLALGTSTTPAARSPWHDLALAAVLAGKPLTEATVKPLPPDKAVRHWAE